MNRNEVWRYNTKVWGNRRTRIYRFLFRGAPLGFAAFLGTIAFEEYFGIYKDHGHGHGHGSNNEHGEGGHH